MTDLTKYPWWRWPAVIAVLAAWITYPFVLHFALPPVLDQLPSPNHGAQLGQLGDMFGALNCLFSTLAFVGLAVSLHMQRKQFEASLEDMKGNAAAAEHQAMAMEKQTKVMRKQNRIAVTQMEVTKLSALLNSKTQVYQSIVARQGHKGIVPETYFKQIQELEKQLSDIYTEKLRVDD